MLLIELNFRIFFELLIIIVEISFSNAFSIILHLNKLWRFVTVFRIRWKLFHNLCWMGDFSFLFFLSSILNKIKDYRRDEVYIFFYHKTSNNLNLYLYTSMDWSTSCQICMQCHFYNKDSVSVSKVYVSVKMVSKIFNKISLHVSFFRTNMLVLEKFRNKKYEHMNYVFWNDIFWIRNHTYYFFINR